MANLPKRKILPFFIPMEGCPNACIYCDQQAISGELASPLLEQISSQITALPDDFGGEIAFYGGSFSMLPRSRQQQYLNSAAAALKSGKLQSVRISTRPDGVDSEELDFLDANGVETIELGIQSFDDDVLRRSNRGYSAEQAVDACRRVKDHGFNLGMQLMTGLPGDNRQKSLASVWQCRSLAADMLRIYPTVVLKNTPLAVLYKRGEYRPQTLDEAVSLCRDMAAVCIDGDITIIRLGLNPAPSTAAAVIEGPYHPAFGHLVYSALKLRQMEIALERSAANDQLFYPPADASLVSGQNGANKSLLQQKYPNLRLIADKNLPSQAVATADMVYNYRQFISDFLAEE